LLIKSVLTGAGGVEVEVVGPVEEVVEVVARVGEKFGLEFGVGAAALDAAQLEEVAHVLSAALFHVL